MVAKYSPLPYTYLHTFSQNCLQRIVSNYPVLKWIRYFFMWRRDLPMLVPFTNRKAICCNSRVELRSVWRLKRSTMKIINNSVVQRQGNPPECQRYSTLVLDYKSLLLWWISLSLCKVVVDYINPRWHTNRAVILRNFPLSVFLTGYVRLSGSVPSILTRREDGFWMYSNTFTIVNFRIWHVDGGRKPAI